MILGLLFGSSSIVMSNYFLHNLICSLITISLVICGTFCIIKQYRYTSKYLQNYKNDLYDDELQRDI